jgi:hypothetical protein
MKEIRQINDIAHYTVTEKKSKAPVEQDAPATKGTAA